MTLTNGLRTAAIALAQPFLQVLKHYKQPQNDTIKPLQLIFD